MQETNQRLRQFGVSELLATRFGDRFADRSISEEDWNDWTATVDDSDYGWSEWVEAVLLLDDRIQGDGAKPKRPELKQLAGYVSCAAEGARGAGILDPLPGVVDEAFRTYGYAESE